MKRLLIFCSFVLAPLAVAIAYSTVHGYTRWFFRELNAQVFVDGRAVQGYVHTSKRVMFLTRRDLSKPHTYAIGPEDNGTGHMVVDCEQWVAPGLPVFALGDVNTPCTPIAMDEPRHQPEVPASCAIMSGAVLQFRTKDGTLIGVVR